MDSLPGVEWTVNCPEKNKKKALLAVMQRGFFLLTQALVSKKSDTNSVTGECPTGQRAQPFSTASRAEPAPPEG